MNRILSLLALAFLLSSCNKDDGSSIVWEKSFGEGQAFFIEQTSDSGFFSCGTVSGKPFLIKFTRERKQETEYKASVSGLFSSGWSSSRCYIAAGSSEGKMLLSRIDRDGYPVWDTTLSAGFAIERASLVHEGEGNFLAIGTGDASSFNDNESGIFFVRIDSSGQVTDRIEKNGSSFLSAGQACTDQSGNIYIPLTSITAGLKPKAVVAKYSKGLNRLWETELYNNPNFAASCNSLIADEQGNIYVTGEMEASNASGVLKNSFLASMAPDGEVNWKKYLENSNSGAAVLDIGGESLAILNSNCFIIRITYCEDGADAGIVRMFSQCDSYTTDAYGADIAKDSEGNYLCAGSLGGNFYIAVKSPQ
jgi:hypothetical protein